MLRHSLRNGKRHFWSCRYDYAIRQKTHLEQCLQPIPATQRTSRQKPQVPCSRLHSSGGRDSRPMLSRWNCACEKMFVQKYKNFLKQQKKCHIFYLKPYISNKLYVLLLSSVRFTIKEARQPPHLFLFYKTLLFNPLYNLCLVIFEELNMVIDDSHSRGQWNSCLKKRFVFVLALFG